MSRTKGSDDLYRLVHSLSTEEKGYFKKFARRHTSGGNLYLQLFDAVNAQPVYQENLLKKRFKDFARKKVYLKEIILDSLLVYNRNTHEHIGLLNQVQKILVLLEKGLLAEAEKLVVKAIAESKRMEVFTIQRYLLRLQNETSAYKKETEISSVAHCDLFKASMAANNLSELSITDWELELRYLQAHIIGITANTTTANLPVSDPQPPVTGLRSRIDQLFFESKQLLYQRRINESYAVSKKLLPLVRKFQQQNDHTFSTFGYFIRHAGICYHLKKHAEAVDCLNELFANKYHKGYTADIAFYYGMPFKITSLFFMGRYKEAEEEAARIDAKMIQLSAKLKAKGAYHNFLLAKLVVLFVNRQYVKCWQVAQQVVVKQYSKMDMGFYCDIAMFQLMVQFELKNLDALPDMVKKFRKLFKKNKLEDPFYFILLNFFEKVNVPNKQALAKTTLHEIQAYYKKAGIAPRFLFYKLKYEFWFDEISGGTPINKAMKDWFKKEGI